MRDVEKREKEIGMVNEGSSLQFTSGDRGVGPNFWLRDNERTLRPRTPANGSR